MGRLAYDLRVIRALALKDVKSALTERLFTILSIAIPVNFLLLFLLFVLTGGQAPTAVVLEADGPYARQFAQAMAGAHSFIIHETTAARAADLLRRGDIVAIVTVPAGFDAALRAGRAVVLPVRVNNLNVDFTNDIRRAVPLAITTFAAQAFPGRVVVSAHEIDIHTHDTGYVAYLGVSIVVVGLMVAGLLQAGTAAAREYETGTIKELLLSPASRWAIAAGKVLGALMTTLISVLVVLAVVVLFVGIWPDNWGQVALDTALLMITFVALGTLIGTVVGRRQAVIPLSLGLALPLFFASGAFGPTNWGNPVAGAFARIEPVTYAIAVFQHAFHGFQTTQSSIAADQLVLVGFTLLAIVASAATFRWKGMGR